MISSTPREADYGEPTSIANRNSTLVLTALIPLAISTTPAFGDSTASPASPAPAVSPASQGGALNEVIVTATRREERLQDVGISVSVVGKNQLQELNINDAYDLVRAVPSLKMNAFSTAAVVWNIRGVSQNDYGDQQEPPVAVYQDDSYSSSLNTSSFPLFDLARTEVLRGPQGTLFGRNATGGLIQFISNKPTKAFEAYGSVTYGSYAQQIYEGAVSGPLTEGLQARVAGIYETSNGYIRNVTPGAPDLFGANHYALRGILAWQPTDSSNVSLILRYLRAPQERQAGGYSFDPACPNQNLQGAFEAPNASCPFWGNPPGTDGSGKYRNDAISPSRGGDPWSTAGNDAPLARTNGKIQDDRRTVGATLRIDAPVGPVSLVSISDYQHWTKNYLEDDDSSPYNDSQFYLNNEVTQLSEELHGSMQFGQHNLVAGLFWMRINGDYIGGFPIHFIGYEPQVTFSEDTYSWAAFAQDEWKLNDQFKLIAGLRYWHDERIGDYYGHAPVSPLSTQPDVLIIFNPQQIYPGGSHVTPADADKFFDGITARAELDYKPNDDLLFYASYNRGSKSGGFTFSTGTPFAPNQPAFLDGIPYKPELLQAYEVGTKATVTSNTAINASVFYYDYKDYQAFAQVGVIQTVVNLAATELGAELELVSHPVTGLSLQLGASWLDSRVKDVLLPDAVTVVDHDLPQTPRWSGNALARYEHRLADDWFGSIQGDVLLTGRFCFTVLCAPVEHEHPYTVGNFRIGATGLDGRLELAAFVNNVANRAYRQYAFDASQFSGVSLGIFARPRTYGVSASYHFRSSAR
jgi:iron complex outermembrane receptor protein